MGRAGRLLVRAAAVVAFLGVLLVRPASAHEDGTPVSVSGEFEVVIADDFEHGSQTFFFVREVASHRAFELHFEAPPGHLRTGQPVAVHGRARGRVLEVEEIEALGEPGGPTGGEAAAAAPQQRAALLLLVDLRDARASDLYTLEQIAGHMWTGARSVDGLVQAASWDQLSFPPDTDADGFADAFGPYTIDYPAANCDPYGWAAAADAAASADGVNLSLYRHRVYVLPRYDRTGCSWAGLGNVGCGTYCRSWIAEGESPMVYAHELGHNLGMGHAATDPENDGTPNVEYGDASDPMGSSRLWHVFNGAHTDQMGWFAGYPGTLVPVASDGVFDLFPLSLHPLATGGVRALRVDRANGERYYLSYRQRLGYDDSLASTYTGGVSVHRFAGGSSYTHYIRTLADGGLFEDPALGLSVVQLGRASDGSYATVEVSFGCLAQAPALVVSPASQAGPPGATLAYSVSVTNRDGSACGASEFPLSLVLPPGLEGSLAAASLSLAPGASGTTTLTVATAPGVDARYDFSVQASGAGGTGSDSATAVADATPPTAPTLAGVLKRRTQVELSFGGASDGSGSGIAAYRVHREGGSAPLDVTVSGSPYVDRATTSGVTYTYTVFARDALGLESAPSNAVTLTAGASGGGSGGGKGGGKPK